MIRNNKGYTGVDITISLTIIVIFVSVIAALSYNFSLASKKVQRKGEAAYLIIQILEEIKQKNFDEVNNPINVDEILDDEHDGYNIDLKVQSYKEYKQRLSSEQGTEQSLSETSKLKVVTVKVEYKVGNTTENLEISTLLVKTD